jgi:hypothetical protein
LAACHGGRQLCCVIVDRVEGTHVVGTALLEAPFLQPTLEFMHKIGAPWVFGSDAPAALVEDRGWTAAVTDMAVPGNEWKRWAHPPIPADVPNAPRGYFVEAIKA